MQMTLKIIDTENGFAIFASEDRNHRVRVSIGSLPEGIRVGDCVHIAILPDLEKLEEVRRLAENTLSSIAVGDFSGLQTSKKQLYSHVIFRQLRELTSERKEGFLLKDLSHAADTIATALCGKDK
jgi:hypothetical protein